MRSCLQNCLKCFSLPFTVSCAFCIIEILALKNSRTNHISVCVDYCLCLSSLICVCVYRILWQQNLFCECCFYFIFLFFPLLHLAWILLTNEYVAPKIVRQENTKDDLKKKKSVCVWGEAWLTYSIHIYPFAMLPKWGIK